MEIHRANTDQCPKGAIAVAINPGHELPHSGIVYTDGNGAVRFCDLVLPGLVLVRELPGRYFWTPVDLDAAEATQVAVFVEMIARESQGRRVSYSFIYPTTDGFDAIGRILEGVGFTCATFVSSILGHLQFHVVDITTWRLRPIQDARFRADVIEFARDNGLEDEATRLTNEPEHFRLKPSELFGSATHSRYPVKFRQATKLAKTVRKLLGKYP